MSLLGLLVGLAVLMSAVDAQVAHDPVELGTAESFAVLAGSGVTNTGPTVLNGDLGTCPTPAITGFPPGQVNGTVHANDALACGAQSDATIAYDDAAGRAPTTTYAGTTDVGGTTLTAGVYKSPSSFAITGALVLDAQGDPSAVFIFQAGSTVITAPNSDVVLINGAQACNVFWQVGSSATLGVGSTFIGTVIALTSITANTDAEVDGRLLARNGAVTLDSNVVTTSTCADTTTSSSTSSSSTAAGTSSSTSTTSSATTTRAGIAVTTAPSATTGPPSATTGAGSPTTSAASPTSTSAGSPTTDGGDASTSTQAATAIAPTSPTTTAGSSGGNLGVGGAARPAAPADGPAATILPVTGTDIDHVAMVAAALFAVGLALSTAAGRGGLR